MNLAVATSSALGAAALFAVATAVQSRAVRGVASPTARFGDGGYGSSPPVTTRELRVVTRAVTSGPWLVGTGIAAAAFACHALALHEGPLSLVQPLLVTMVLFALPVSRAVNGTAVTAVELGWAVVLVLGLTAFFAAADPVSPAAAGADVQPAILTASLAALTIGLCVGLARHRPGGQAAALLGGAAGIAFAGVAALVKAATNMVTHGVGAVMGSWQLYALLGLGAVGDRAQPAGLPDGAPFGQSARPQQRQPPRQCPHRGGGLRRAFPYWRCRLGHRGPGPGRHRRGHGGAEPTAWDPWLDPARRPWLRARRDSTGAPLRRSPSRWSDPPPETS